MTQKEYFFLEWCILNEGITSEQWASMSLLDKLKLEKKYTSWCEERSL